MLKIVRSLKDLPFSSLMEVYVEGNRENGSEFYPDLSAAQQLLRAEQDFYQYLREGFFTQPEDCYCLWEAEGQILSALRLQRYQDGLLLEALETRPDHRRQGWGEGLVRAALAAFSGQKIYVHIANWNEPSRKLHEKCGFFKILDHAVYADGSVTNRACTYMHNG